MANLYGRAWRKRRARQLAEHPLCRLCMDVRGLVTVAVIADHLRPHRGNPELFEGELQSLCKACHDGWKQAVESGGHMKGCDLAGMPLDPNHAWNREKHR